MTKSNLQPYNITNLVGDSNHQAGPQMTQCEQHEAQKSVAEQWVALAGSGSKLSKLLSDPFAARGIYTYQASARPSPELPRTDRVEYELHITGCRLYGTSKDTVGNATVDGQIDIQRDTVRFIKHYVALGKRARWEYEGHFTPCGIVGEWHYPGDPPKLRHHRGRFAIWLQSDEAAEGQDFEDQIRLLENQGALLTRSLSFKGQ